MERNSSKNSFLVLFVLMIAYVQLLSQKSNAKNSYCKYNAFGWCSYYKFICFRLRSVKSNKKRNGYDAKFWLKVLLSANIGILTVINTISKKRLNYAFLSLFTLFTVSIATFISVTCLRPLNYTGLATYSFYLAICSCVQSVMSNAIETPKID